MADIETLLGLNVSADGDMSAMAEALRRQQNAGNILGLSGNSKISNLGSGMSSNANDAAKRAGALRSALVESKRQQGNTDRMFDQTVLNQNRNHSLQQSQFKYQKEKDAAAQDAALKKAVAELAEKKRVEQIAADKRDRKTYHHPTEEGRVLNFNVGPNGGHFTMAGDPVDPELVETLTPYSTGATASVQKLAAKEQEKIDETEKQNETDFAVNELIGKTLLDENLLQATGGPYDIGRMLASDTALYPGAQSVQTKLASLTLDAIAEPLSKLGVNPTDKDLEFAMSTFPTENKDPVALIAWYGDQFTPGVVRNLRKQGRDADADAFQRQADNMIAKASKNIEGQRTNVVEDAVELFNRSKAVAFGENPDEVIRLKKAAARNQPSMVGWDIRERGQ